MTRATAKPSFTCRSARLLIAILLCCPGLACSNRTYTKSRSELLASGDPGASRSIEEDRHIFESIESENATKLRTVVEQRLHASGDPLYRIGSSDEIEVHVFDVPELNFTARVSEGGFLSVPLVGSVKAVGLTVEEVTSELRRSVAEYVKDPRISLAVVGYGSQRVAVLGAVRNPGVYPLRKGSTGLLEVIGEAGGISPKAGTVLSFIPVEVSKVGAASSVEDRARLSLERSSVPAGDSNGVEIPLQRILGTGGDLPIEIPLRGGDTIVVPESGAVSVEGEVLRVGTYELGPQMTLLGALAAAGGITFGANVREVEVVRTFPRSGKASLVFDLEEVARGTKPDTRLRAGDVVRVPTNTGRRLSQDTFDGITKVLNFGVGGHVNVGP